MKLKTLFLVGVAGFATLAATLPSVAQTFDPSIAQEYDVAPTVAPFLQRGSTIRNAAIANQYAPGLAQEIAPDTTQSATGGPSGGYGRGGGAGAGGVTPCRPARVYGGRGQAELAPEGWVRKRTGTTRAGTSFPPRWQG